MIAVVFALLSGLVVGKIVALTGRRIEPYTDSEEFVTEDAEEKCQG
jgi:hypothetical protein